MKLQIYWIAYSELQDYLDKYQDKIKFINIINSKISGLPFWSGKMIMLIIDEGG